MKCNLKYEVKKKKLFRSENKITHNGIPRDLNYRSRWKRHSKEGMSPRMGGSHINHNLDYTPLFQFLLSKDGKPWNEIWKECLERVDRPDPILWMVQGIRINGLPDNKPGEYKKCFRYGEGTYFSTMYVDDSGILRIVDKDYVCGPSYEEERRWGETFNGNLYETYKRPKRK